MTRILRDERGVALPLALVGLTLVTVLVSGAMLSASTEVAVSNAHQTASGSLHRAEATVERYVAEVNVATIEAAAGTSFTYVPTGTSDSARITLTRLGQRRVGTDGWQFYSIEATPIAAGQPRGRRVMAFVEVPVDFAPPPSFNTSVKAGATLGNNADIGGSIDINSSSGLCAKAGADHAIEHAKGTSVTVRGQAAKNIGASEIKQSELAREGMAERILGGDVERLMDLADGAEIKFGNKWGQPAFNSSLRPNATHSDPAYRWGCPKNMRGAGGCPGSSGDEYKFVAIDASNADGSRGEVRLNGDYGQGMLVIVGGSLRIQGNFQYNGIILVEGSTDIHGGGGGGGSKIEGALLGLGDLTICTSGTGCTDSGGTSEMSDFTSGAVIQFNRCTLDDVQEQITKRYGTGTVKPIVDPTFAWLERAN